MMADDDDMVGTINQQDAQPANTAKNQKKSATPKKPVKSASETAFENSQKAYKNFRETPYTVPKNPIVDQLAAAELQRALRIIPSPNQFSTVKFHSASDVFQPVGKPSLGAADAVTAGKNKAAIDSIAHPSYLKRFHDAHYNHVHSSMDEQARGMKKNILNVYFDTSKNPNLSPALSSKAPADLAYLTGSPNFDRLKKAYGFTDDEARSFIFDKLKDCDNKADDYLEKYKDNINANTETIVRKEMEDKLAKFQKKGINAQIDTGVSQRYKKKKGTQIGNDDDDQNLDTPVQNMRLGGLIGRTSSKFLNAAGDLVNSATNLATFGATHGVNIDFFDRFDNQGNPRRGVKISYSGNNETGVGTLDIFAQSKMEAAAQKGARVLFAQNPSIKGISLSGGTKNQRRAAWLEAKKIGIEQGREITVAGYEPNAADIAEIEKYKKQWANDQHHSQQITVQKMAETELKTLFGESISKLAKEVSSQQQWDPKQEKQFIDYLNSKGEGLAKDIWYDEFKQLDKTSTDYQSEVTRLSEKFEKSLEDWWNEKLNKDEINDYLRSKKQPELPIDKNSKLSFKKDNLQPDDDSQNNDLSYSAIRS